MQSQHTQKKEKAPDGHLKEVAVRGLDSHLFCFYNGSHIYITRAPDWINLDQTRLNFINPNKVINMYKCKFEKTSCDGQLKTACVYFWLQTQTLLTVLKQFSMRVAKKINTS